MHCACGGTARACICKTIERHMYPSVKNADVAGRRVLCRVDMDVPVRDGAVVSSPRLQAMLEMVSFLQERRARVILMGHRGRPNGPDAALSTKPVCAWLAGRLPKGMVRFLPFDDYGVLVEEVHAMANGDVLVLENLRFHPAEEQNDSVFAKQLADLAQLYVNDAFATSHRAHASMVGVPMLMGGYIGLHMERELEALQVVREASRRPFVVIIGGAKISSKLEAMEAFLQSADRVFVGGAIATTFFAAQGLNVGASFMMKEEVTDAKRMIESDRLQLPTDVVLKSRHGYRTASPGDLRDNEEIVDIGVSSVRGIQEAVQKADMFVWNGPVGVVEDARSRAGTDAVAHIVARRSRTKAFGVVGGGDTLDVIETLGIADLYDFVSTGGGAMLKYVGGGVLPALEALKKNT